ncbi:MAG: hypothetical protein ABI721_03150 [Candidatus Dojkabacteria bacterium]
MNQSPEVPVEFKSLVYSALNNAFDEVGNKVENSNQKFEAAAEIQNNNANPQGPIAVQTGVQNLLITLLIQLARQLGLKEDELEKVFDEVLKLIHTYKNKKGES